MDSSQVQSILKSSDFSIDRILSDDKKRNEDAVEAPDWLCCTRYRPPRLPRSSTVSSRSRRSGRHARVPFTAAQASALETAYARAPYLAPPALRALASALHLRDDRIKIWFQNRRARERREKCATITPPNEVTLPPSTNGLMIASNNWSRSPLVAHSSAYTATNLNDIFYINNESVDSTSSNEDIRRSLSESEYSYRERPESPVDVETI